MAQTFGQRLRLYGTTRTPERLAAIRSNQATPLILDLTNKRAVRRVATLANYWVVLAPPPNQGETDPGSQALVNALRMANGQRGPMCSPRICYVSTTGVYGDCAGRKVTELETLKPTTLRAKRRVAAESAWHALAKSNGARLAVLRAPGIYAEDRLPIERLQQGTPALQDSDDVFTNHIHAQDLAQLSVTAMLRVKGRRNFNASDSSNLKMGEYFDKVADHFGLARAPRVGRDLLATQVTPMMLSFMSESRQVDGSRILRELHTRLRYPNIDATLLKLKRA